jgi:hypothetical protein
MVHFSKIIVLHIFRLQVHYSIFSTVGVKRQLQAKIHSPNSHYRRVFEKDVDLFFYFLFYFWITMHFSDRSLDCINLT